MRILYILLFALTLVRVQAQEDTARVLSGYFKELKAACAAPSAQLWGRSLYGPVLFVDIPQHRLFANQPDSQGLFQPYGDIYKGALSPALSVANTSVEWGGVRWAMVLLPLPDTASKRLSLLMHESFHRIQYGLGLPPQSPVCGHLDSKAGRIWLRLELAALAKALQDPVGERREDLQNALLFRAYRYALYPEGRQKEHALEWNEGLAEFTGVYASDIWETDPGYLQRLVQRDTNYASFTRSFAYLTGPLYGVLLSQRRADWPIHVKATDNFETLIREEYGLDDSVRVTPAKGAALMALASDHSTAYGGDVIQRQEDAREARHQVREKAYRASMIDGPVLVIPAQGHVNISFNPNDLFVLTGAGTIYPEMTMKNDWGNLEVTGGALMADDWQHAYLPVDDSVRAARGSGVLHGPGWTLTLQPGWKIAPGPRKGDLTLVKE